MLSLLFLVASLASTSLSAPTQTVHEQGELAWSPLFSDFYSAVSHHIALIKEQPNFPNPPPCDLSKAVMPAAITPLPVPGPGQVLRHVAIGRGTQNYTCSVSSPTIAPVSIGAVASLYNASCIAATYPDLLAMLPNIALQHPIPQSPSTPLRPSNLEVSGHHFFKTTTTAVFNLNTTPTHQYGLIVAKRVANSTAPANAPEGRAEQGNGSVPWLCLQSRDGTTGGLKTAYRVNTAGGSPPKTCENMPAVFTVDYASEYWFYGDA